MNLDELKAEFDRMEREAFRLQQHQSYAGVQGPEWEAWHAGKPLPAITPESHPFLKKVAGYIEAGRRVYDVHIVEWPLAEYTRYALAVIPMSAWDGSEVFMVDRDTHPDLATLTEDFWMIDERLVAIMQYDDDYRPLEPAESTEPVERYVAQRDLALKHAVPLHDWVAEHQELLSG